ncbi:MAG: hypothetical protein ACREIA_07460 [Opitutaceae bacterium]
MNLLHAIQSLLVSCSLAAPAGFASARLFEAPEIVSLDALKVTGDLALKVPLAHLRFSSDVFLDLYLEHRLETSDCGVSRSTWIMPALETSLYPDGGNHMLWIAPGGKRRRFSLSEAKGLGIEGWRLNFASQGEVEIEGGRWTLSYRSGQLVRIDAGRTVVFMVDASAGRVKALISNGRIVLSADYRADRRPLAVTLGGRRFVMAYHAGRLVKVCNDAGNVLLEVEYRNELVSAITTGGQRSPIEWSRTPEFGRGDSRAIHARSLERFNEIDYDYAIDGDLVILQAVSPQGARVLYHNIVSGRTVVREH